MDTSKLDPEQLEWYEILTSGMRLRKPANEARKVPTAYGPNVDLRFRKLVKAMRMAGMHVVAEPVTTMGYTYATYRLAER